MIANAAVTAASPNEKAVPSAAVRSESPVGRLHTCHQVSMVAAELSESAAVR